MEERNRPIAWKDPQIVYMDRVDALAAGTTDTDADTGEITIRVPQPVDALSRVVLEHEKLHAKYDAPVSLAASDAEVEWLERHSIPNDADNGIADAKNHLLYWPHDPGLEADLAAVSFHDLNNIASHINAPSDWNQYAVYSHRNSMVVMVRSMASLKRLGRMDAEELRTAQHVFTAQELTSFDHIMELLSAKKFHSAKIALRDLLPLPSSDEVIDPDAWGAIGFRGKQFEEQKVRQLEALKRVDILGALGFAHSMGMRI